MDPKNAKEFVAEQLAYGYFITTSDAVRQFDDMMHGLNNLAQNYNANVTKQGQLQQVVDLLNARVAELKKIV
jgi:hypothetical protein